MADERMEGAEKSGMKRRMPQLAIGLTAGIAAWASLPGAHPGGFLAAAAVSLAGAVVGEALAEIVLPEQLLRQGGYLMASLGAIVTLLAQAVLFS